MMGNEMLGSLGAALRGMKINRTGKGLGLERSWVKVAKITRS